MKKQAAGFAVSIICFVVLVSLANALHFGRGASFEVFIFSVFALSAFAGGLISPKLTIHFIILTATIVVVFVASTTLSGNGKDLAIERILFSALALGAGSLAAAVIRGEISLGFLGGVTMSPTAPLSYHVAQVMSENSSDHSHTSYSLERDYTRDTQYSPGYKLNSKHHRDERQSIWLKDLKSGEEFRLNFNNESLAVREGHTLCLGCNKNNGQVEMYYNYQTNTMYNMCRGIPSEERTHSLRSGIGVESFLIGALPYLGLAFGFISPLIYGLRLRGIESSCYEGMFTRLFFCWVLFGAISTLSAGFIYSGEWSVSLLGGIGIFGGIGILCSIIAMVVSRSYSMTAINLKRNAFSELSKESDRLNPMA